MHVAQRDACCSIEVEPPLIETDHLQQERYTYETRSPVTLVVIHMIHAGEIRDGFVRSTWGGGGGDMEYCKS